MLRVYIVSLKLLLCFLVMVCDGQNCLASSSSSSWIFWSFQMWSKRHSDGFGVVWATQKLQFWKCDERKVQPTLPNQKSVKFLQNQFQTFVPLLFSPPHCMYPLPPHVHERQNPETGQPPHSRRGTLLHIHNWAPLSLKPLPLSLHLHTKHSSPPLTPPPTHQLLQVAPVWCKIRSCGNKARGRVGPPWQFLNTTCSTLLQPTLQNTPPAMAALNGHTRRHLFTLGGINDDLRKIQQ